MLGDSNLKLELPYGVQEHRIEKAAVHENYDVNDDLHQNDLGQLTVPVGSVLVVYYSFTTITATTYLLILFIY